MSTFERIGNKGNIGEYGILVFFFILGTTGIAPDKQLC